MRAIDADALIETFEDRLEKIRNCYGDYSGEAGVCAGALHLIREQPTIEPERKKAEQPEIIRCKDCKHRPEATRESEGINYGYSVVFPDEECPCRCGDEWYNWYPEDDFYCGCAERREEVGK